jgi:hypothetical protein
MFLPELCIKRPVLATVMSLAIILIGVITFLRLPSPVNGTAPWKLPIMLTG